MRLAEVIQEFRNIHHQIAQVKVDPTGDEQEGEGYQVLRECSNEGRAILTAPFLATEDPPEGDSDKEKDQLHR